MQSNVPTISASEILYAKYSPSELQRLENAARSLSNLNSCAVIDTAREETGLHDLGSDDFEDRMNCWLTEAKEDPNRTCLGKQAVFRIFVKHVCTRLRLEKLLQEYPEINDMEVEKPLFITGPFRSGTTHLHGLLAADSRFRSFRVWESTQPIPDMPLKILPEKFDPRFQKQVEAWNRVKNDATFRTMLAMHPLEPTGVAEETDDLQGPDFANCIWDWPAPDRTWRNHYPGPDHTPRYEYLKTMLRALQWLRGPHRWLLKSPHHLNYLPSLLKAFPDATVVMTHRDPVAVIQSGATMWSYAGRLQYYYIDPRKVIERWADRVDIMLSNGIANRHLFSKGNLLDVKYDDIKSDILGVVERIYAAIEMNFSTQERDQVESFFVRNPPGKYGRVKYDLRNDFDTEPGELHGRFKLYRSQFGVSSEIS